MSPCAWVLGRGRGDGGFYQRSFDDVEGFGRGGREMHRSQSWEERFKKKKKEMWTLLFI